MVVNRRIEERVGYVELDNPPVNAIGQAMRASLLEAVAWAEAEALDRVVLSGAGRGFAAGADAREFDLPPQAPHLPDVLARIDASPVPWIAAVHGPALGGGCEIMLACRARIAHPGATIGLPEVTLGIVPGAGGTQRLPRLIGADAALSLVATGKPVTGAAARDLGLIDLLSDDPIAAAAAMPLHDLPAPVAGRPCPSPTPDAITAARKEAAKRMRGHTAPLRAIDLVEAAARLPFADGMARERATFLELRVSDQARALRHVFFAERAARLPEALKPAVPADPEQIAVVGGGTMGTGIAYALLTAGAQVIVLEADDDGTQRAAKKIETLIHQGLTRGRLTEAGAEDLQRRLTLTTDYAAAASAGLAIEAVFENMDLKAEILLRLEGALPADAILATNTSYLDIDALARRLANPGRFLGLHFFAPAHVMKLLEIVRGARTSDGALAAGFRLAKRLGKIPVVAGVCDGFIGNRILARYREAADTLVLDGASPYAVDATMAAFGYAMGPYAVQDLSGLDIGFANRRRQDATRAPRRRYIRLGDRLVEEGRLGRKTAKGWYLYSEDGMREDPEIKALIADEARKAGVTRRAIGAEEIRHRLVLAMINEAADILWAGIAERASDIDLVTIHGYGFPRWRGGLMHHADEIGAASLHAQLVELCAEDPVAWRPSPTIAACAQTGVALADWRPAT